MQSLINVQYLLRRVHRQGPNIFHYMMALFIAGMIISCAKGFNQSPSGGPRDKTPPAIDTVKSTPNYQVRFSEKKFELVFDEWIQTRNLIQKLIVSPPLQYLPKLETRGKKVTVEFHENEILKEDATYIFNFGDAIRDFRESNALENFTFVFSTGDIIDSLGFSGTVIDAYSGEPVQDAFVMLYDTLADSIVYQEKPFYFVKTDKEGKYTFQNIRSDTFKLFVLKDGNVNYVYEEGLEMIGFREESIILTDSFNATIELEAFTERVPNTFVKKEYQDNGQVKLRMKQEIDDSVVYRTEPPIAFLQEEFNKDTLILWYRDTTDFTIYIGEDTIPVNPMIRKSFSNQSLQLVEPRGNNLTLSPIDSIELTFNRPLEFFIPDSIYITDSTSRIAVTGSIHEKSVTFKGKWMTDSSYQVAIMPGAVRGYYGSINDTISLNLKANSIEKYGDIIFSLYNMDTLFSYIVHLQKGNDILDRKTVSGQDSVSITFNTLPAGDYTIEVIEDKNGNGKWDPGIYLQYLQAEDRKVIKLEKLRENWELNAKHEWDE